MSRVAAEKPQPEPETTRDLATAARRKRQFRNLDASTRTRSPNEVRRQRQPANQNEGVEAPGYSEKKRGRSVQEAHTPRPPGYAEKRRARSVQEAHTPRPPGYAEKRRALHGILSLERERGFDNSAVIGGLDRFLEESRAVLPWLASLFPPAIRHYAELSVPQRKAWAAAADKRISQSHGAPSRPARSARPSRAASHASPAPRPRVTLDSPLASLRFISAPNRPRFERIGVATLRDVLYLFPTRHVDYSKVTPVAVLSVDDETTVIGTVTRAEAIRIGPPPGAARIVINDSTGLLTVTWFRQAYLAERLRPGVRLAVSGRVNEYRGRAQMENPEYEVVASDPGKLVHAGNLLPIYPSTEGLPQRTIRNAAQRALSAGLSMIQDHIPQAVLKRLGMRSLAESIRRMHFPATHEEYAEARERLAFDELFLNQLAALRRKQDWAERRGGVPIEGGQVVARKFVEGLDFSLTHDQREALDTILQDISRPVPMGRMLQGEVGSGKTVVALAALLAAASEHTGAFMAPTEVLAEQHFLSASRQLEAKPSHELPEAVAEADLDGSTITLALLTGSMRKSAASRVREMVADGKIDILIGTHALFQDAVDIPRLALLVVDEQHRFGVEQRGILAERTPRPHLLVMSATPIPRSLALTVFGDLELSTLREMPKGRKPISNQMGPLHTGSPLRLPPRQAGSCRGQTGFHRMPPDRGVRSSQCPRGHRRIREAARR